MISPVAYMIGQAHGPLSDNLTMDLYPGLLRNREMAFLALFYCFSQKLQLARRVANPKNRIVQ
jgi:hypothetical protein